MSNALRTPQLGYMEALETIADLLRAADPKDPLPVVCIEGTTGCGKSQIPRYLAAALEVPMVLEDFAGKQAEDIIGIPEVREGETYFALPWYFSSTKDMNRIDREAECNARFVAKLKELLSGIPAENMPERVLFIDEYNRPAADAHQPAMGLLLEGRLQDRYMPLRTLIILAGNQPTSKEDYDVSQLDTAQQERMLRLELRTELKEWESYVESFVHPGIVSWARNHTDCIRSLNPDSGLVSFRRVTQLGAHIERLEQHSPAILQDRSRMLRLISLYVPISLGEGVYQEVLNTAIHLDTEDVLRDYDKVADQVQKIRERNRLDVLHRVCDHIPPFIVEMSKDKRAPIEKEVLAENLLRFVHALPRSTAFMLLFQLAIRLGEAEKDLIIDVLALIAQDESLPDHIEISDEDRTKIREKMQEEQKKAAA